MVCSTSPNCRWANALPELALRRALGDYDQRATEGDMVWIYANPIYVRR